MGKATDILAKRKKYGSTYVNAEYDTSKSSISASEILNNRKINKYREELNSYDIKSLYDYKDFGLSEDKKAEYKNTLSNYKSALENLKMYDSSISDDDYKSYLESIDSLSAKFDLLSSYKTEDEYKAAVKASEIEKEKETADLSVIENELKDLESKKGEYVSLKTKRDNLYSTILSGYRRAHYSETEAKEKALSDGRIVEYDKQLSNFGDMSSVDNTITEKKQYLNTAKVIQAGKKLADDALNDEKFELYAQKGEEMGSQVTKGGWLHGDTYDNYLAYLRNTPGELERIEKLSKNREDVLQTFPLYKEAKYMNDDEFKIYNSYIGKGDEESANNYLKSLENTINQRMGAAISERMESDAQRILFAAKAGIDQFNSGMQNLLNFNDNYIAPSAIQYASGYVRQDLSDTGVEILGSSLGQIGYDALSTTTNMLPSILTSVAVGTVSKTAGAIVGNTLMGASAAGNAYQEALNKGFDKGQARMYSTLVGGSEALLQYALGGLGTLGGLGDDAVKGVINNIDNAFARVSLKLGTNMASEFTEEYLQEVLTPVFSNFALNTNEDVKLFSADALYAGMLGALTAASLGSVDTAVEEISTANEGRKIKKSGETSNLVEFGKSLSADTVAYTLAGKINEKTGAYSIGRLLHEAGADSLSQTNLDDITTALVKNNVTPEDTQTIAKWLNKVVEGGNLTKKQQIALENNDVISKVFKETIIDSNSTVNQRLQALNDIRHGMESYGVNVDALPTEQSVMDAVNARNEAINYNNYLRRKEIGNHTDFIGEKLADFNAQIEKEGKSSSIGETAVERKYESNNEGKDINTANDKVIENRKLVSSEDGKLKYKVTYEDGGKETVDAENISWGREDEAIVMSAIADMNVPVETAESLLNEYTGSSVEEATTYVKGIREKNGAYSAATKQKSSSVEASAVESKYEVSDEGKAINNATGGHVDIEGIASIEGEKMTLKVKNSEGEVETVAAESISFADEGDAIVYSQISDMGVDAATANAIIQDYNNGKNVISPTRYAKGIDEAYRYGLYGIPAKEMENPQGFASNISIVSRDLVYNLGKDKANTIAREQQAEIMALAKGGAKGKNGKVHFEGDRLALTEIQSESLKGMAIISQVVGNDVHVYKSYVKNGKRLYRDANGVERSAPNGMYYQKDGSIWIDLNAGYLGQGTMLHTYAHELTHFIKEWSPEKFKKLADFLVEQYGEKGVSVDTLVQRQMQKAKRNNRDISYEEAFEEMVADSMTPMLTDGKVIKELYKKDKTLFDKIKSWIDSTLRKLEAIYKGYEFDSDEGRAVAKMTDSLEKMQSLFAEALEDASENYSKVDIQAQKNTTQEGDVLLSERKVYKKSKTYYNEFYSNAMQWAYNAGTKTGDAKVFSVNGKHFVLLEATDNGYIEIAKGNYEEVVLEYERIHSEKDTSFDEDTQEIRTEQNGNLWDLQSNDFGEDGFGDSGQIRGEELQTNTTRNNEHLQSGHKGKHEIKNSDRNYMAAVESGDMETAQRMVDEAAKKAGYTVKAYHGTKAQFNSFKHTKRGMQLGADLGFWFTTNKNVANRFSQTFSEEDAEAFVKWKDTKENEFINRIADVVSPYIKHLSEKEKNDFPRIIGFWGIDQKLKDKFGLNHIPQDTLDKINAISDEYLAFWHNDNKKAEFEKTYTSTAIPTLINAYLKIDNLKILKGEEVGVGWTRYNEIASAEDEGYDGVLIKNGDTGQGIADEYVVFNPEQIKSADTVTYDDNGNVIPLSERFNAENEDIRFSMRENVEETKDLVAVHNLTEEKLLKSLSLGGLPMPSIAIARAKEGHSTFGRISLVFKKETIDPKSSRNNKVYSGDAWTPTYPQIDYKISRDVVHKAWDKISGLLAGTDYETAFGYLGLDTDNVTDYLNRNGGNIYDAYGDKLAIKLAYLKDKGVEVNLPRKQEELSNRFDNEVVIRFAEKYGEEKIREINNADSTLVFEKYIPEVKELVEAYYNNLTGTEMDWQIGLHDIYDLIDSSLTYFRKGIKSKTENSSATRQIIDEAVDAADYEKWLNDLFQGVIEKEGIRNSADMFTPSGNRRSFEALHYEHNLENVIKAMRGRGEKGIGFGGGNIFGAATTEFESIADIKDAANARMQSLSQDEYDAIRHDFSSRFFELAASLPIHKDSFTATDSAADMLIEAVTKFKTKSGMANYLRSESKGWANYSDYIVDDLIELVNEIRNMPTQYFEAKPQRAVGFNEVATAIIPDNSSTELKTKLAENGVKYVEYESGNEQSRLEALNSLEDVKFSDRDAQSLESYKKIAEQLSRENVKLIEDVNSLKELVKMQKTVTHGKVLKASSVEAAAKSLMKYANAKGDVAELVERLNKVYNHILNGEELSWDSISEEARDVVDWLQSHEYHKPVREEYADEALSYLHGLRISLDEYQKQEAIHRFGSYKEFHNSVMGNVIIANDGTPLDSIWRELADRYPMYFDSDAKANDMPVLLADAISDLKNSYVEEYEYEGEMVAQDLLTKVYDSYWNVSTLYTVADAKQKEINLLKSKHNQKMQELRESHADKEIKLKKEYQERLSRMRANYKESADAKIEKVKKEYQESRKKAVEKARETRDKRDAITKLQSLVLETAKWVSNPSKKDVKCPDILRKPYAQLLSSIDLTSKRALNGGEPTKNDLRVASAMDSLAKAIEKKLGAQSPETQTDTVLDTGYLDLPLHYVENLKELSETLKERMVTDGHVVNSMSSEEIKQLTQFIRTLNHSIKEMSTLYSNMRYARVEELGNDTISHLDSLGEIEKTNGVADFVGWENGLPYYVFRRFGKGGESVFEELMDSQDKLAYLAEQILKFKEKTWNDKEAKTWSNDTHTIELPSGKTLTLTTADAMSIYCLSRREQGRQHLLGGGVRVIGIEKNGKKAKDSRSTLNAQDISVVCSTLNERQLEVANAIQEFMSMVCSEWGNEISMKRFLTKEFNEKFYFPIESNDENLDTKDPKAQQSDLYRLLNISATKSLTLGANNEVVIRNIFDVFSNHSSDMARLNAYGMAVLDYMKWLNYREKITNKEGQITTKGVRKSMESAYGSKAKQYVINLIKDINGRVNDGGDHSWLMKLTKSAKTAMVGGNLRVAVLQLTSYPRAAAVLSTKSLALGMKKLPQISKAKKYCGIALWKSFGFYDTNISRSIEDQIKGATNIRQKIIEFSLKGAELGDALTWGCLWNACEYEVAKTKQYKVGSEEFNQAVGKKLREVVYATQVVDSTLTRSQMMRNKSGLTQSASAFMSEPTLSANILMDAGFK